MIDTVLRSSLVAFLTAYLENNGLWHSGVCCSGTALHVQLLILLQFTAGPLCFCPSKFGRVGLASLLAAKFAFRVQHESQCNLLYHDGNHRLQVLYFAVWLQVNGPHHVSATEAFPAAAGVADRSAGPDGGGNVGPQPGYGGTPVPGPAFSPLNLAGPGKRRLPWAGEQIHETLSHSCFGHAHHDCINSCRLPMQASSNNKACIERVFLML